MLHRIAIVPSYCPENTLISVVAGLKDFIPEVVVIDDGGGDKYKGIFGELDATVLTNEVNRGKGYSLKKALKYIADKYPNEQVAAVTVDGDGQHNPKDCKIVLEKAEEEPGSLALGGRELPADAPLRSRFGNSVTRKVFKAVAGFEIKDTQTGLRAYCGKGADLLKFTAIEGDRYEYEMNVLLSLKELNIKAVELPIEVIYADSKNSTSHFRPVRDSLRIYNTILCRNAKTQTAMFVCSSLFCTGLEFLVFWLLSLATSMLPELVSVTFANIASRVLAVAVNFTINRHMVFRSDKNAAVTGTEFFVLAGVILLLSTVCIDLLVNIGVNRYIAKVAVGVAFFFVNWLVQKFFIFKGEKK